MWLLVLFISVKLWISFIPLVNAVDKSTFKTCDQSSFCKRNRAFKTNELEVSFQPESLHVEDHRNKAVVGDRVSGLLYSEKLNRSFTLELNSYKDHTVKVLINEVDPIRNRFRPADAIERQPESQKIELEKVDDVSAIFRTPEKDRLVLTFTPFRVDAYSGKELVLSLNSRGLLNFEHYRTKIGSAGKVKTIATDADGASDAEKDGENEGEGKGEEEAEEEKPAGSLADEHAEGMWDEHFKTHHDSKPHGPSSIGLDVSFVGFQYVYGIPEHADKFVLRTTTDSEPYRLYNLDVFEYELNSRMALYGSVPYLMAHSPQRTVGFLWLNAAETWVDISSNTADKGILRSVVDRFKSSQDVPQMDTHWMSESGVLEAYLFLGPKPYDVFRQYAHLTGVTPLPPIFSLGYHQCRWNYVDVDDVLDVHEKFDFYDIPVDVIWLDIEHTDGKRYFTWDPHKFTNPKDMITSLAAKGRKMVTIVDPHIKKDDNYKIYKEAKEKGLLTKDKHGSDFDGWCWPGSSVYLDFLNPAVQKYWSERFHVENYDESTETLFIWNDMNEPSVFNGPEVTMHKDAKHFGDWEHRDIHNMYGFYHHRSTFQGLYSRSKGRLRPFLLTRSFFVGSQRYGAVWTGDNTADWAHLEASIPMLLSLSISGIPFVGADVGGFFKDPNEELLVRWYQAGAFLPFFRAHAHLDTRRREPWLFSEDALKNIREAIRRRYQLLPYWYTLFYEHSKTGVPVMRPLWAEFPEDKYAAHEERQYLVGGGLLVRPVMEPGKTSVSVYLPQQGSIWYNYDTRKGHPGPGAIYVDTPMDKIPVYIRGGVIIPIRERIRRAASLMLHDPFTLLVALNYKGDFANGTLYEDDGHSHLYETGQYAYRLFEYKGTVRSGEITSKSIADPNSHYVSEVWIEKIVVMGVRYFPESVKIAYGGGAKRLDFKFDKERSVLTIRKPGVKIVTDFSLSIS